MKPPVITISGVTISGNLGGQAMLRAAMTGLTDRLGPCEFRLLSIFPAADAQVAAAPGVSVVAATPLRLLTLALPLSLLYAAFGRPRWLRTLLCRLDYFAALADSDLLVDVAGIAFVDGRGLPLLAYNLATSLPAAFWGVPVAKLAQSLGPFRRPLNRAAARLALSRCDVVIARGERAARHVADLGGITAPALADVSFLLDTGPVAAAARQRVQAHGVPAGFVAVSPSRVVQRVCARSGIDLAAVLAATIEALVGRGLAVALVPHSTGTATSKNNDVALCDDIHRRLDSHPGVFRLPYDDDALLQRAVIGQARAFVGCRYHGVIAALSCGVPPLVIGWSEKYFDLMDRFGLATWVFDATTISTPMLLAHIDRLLAQEPALRATVAAALPGVRAEAWRNIDLAAGVLRPSA